MTRPPASGTDDFDPSDPLHWPSPPEPSARAWEKTRTDIVARLPLSVPRHRWANTVKVAAAVAALAAGVLIAWGVWATFHRPMVEVNTVYATPTDPLAEYDVLPIATSGDVMVSAVRGGDVRFGSISHPVPDSMPLTSAADVTVHRGPTAGELACPEPGGMAVYVMPPADK